MKIGSVESKKGLLFFITALSFGFKCTVERSLLKRLKQPNVTKQTIVVRPLGESYNFNAMISFITIRKLKG